MAKQNKLGSLGELRYIIDYIDNTACSECKHLEIDKHKTLELSKTNRKFKEDKKISVVMAKCTKRPNSKTVKIEEFRVYNGTGLCFNSKYLDYEINK